MDDLQERLVGKLGGRGWPHWPLAEKGSRENVHFRLKLRAGCTEKQARVEGSLVNGKRCLKNGEEDGGQWLAG